MTKCTPCRVRHLTCDQNTICTECSKGNRKCLRGYNLRFRNLTCPYTTPNRADFGKYEFFFDDEQTWVHSNGGNEKIEFVLEGEDVESEVSTEKDDFNNEDRSVGGTANYIGNIGSSAHEIDGPSQVEGSEARTPNTWTKLDILAEASSSGLDSYAGTRLPQQTSSMSTGTSVWPLKDLQEGTLLQHFVTHLAPWFDVGDQKRHFGKVIPYMAVSSPLLMTAVLALSALHHTRVIGKGDSYEAMNYHDRCLSLLVSFISDPSRIKDDSVLITTVILHLYEDLESGSDSIRHLKGTSLFFPPQPSTQSSPLRRALFWIYLEQELYNAYSHHRSVRTDLSPHDIDSYTEDSVSSEDMWYHRILHIAAHVSKWAFSDEPSHVRYRELCQMIDDWETERPSSFSPIYVREPDLQARRYLPEICYVTDEGLIASHFFYLSKLLLTTHDPTLPRIGPALRSATITMQETALSYVRNMVGSAICNSLVTARFTGSLAVLMCSQWIVDRGEQFALLDYMQETDRCSGWPRDHARQRLMQEWGIGGGTNGPSPV